jgi:hypothetical protein
MRMKRWWGQHEWREPVGSWTNETKSEYTDWVKETFGEEVNPNNPFKYAEQYRAVKLVEASVAEPEHWGTSVTERLAQSMQNTKETIAGNLLNKVWSDEQEQNH